MHNFTPLAILAIAASVTAYSDVSDFDIRDLDFDQADEELVIREARRLPSMSFKGIRFPSPRPSRTSLNPVSVGMNSGAPNSAPPLTQRDLDQLELYTRAVRGGRGGRGGGGGSEGGGGGGKGRNPRWRGVSPSGTDTVRAVGTALTAGASGVDSMINGVSNPAPAPAQKRDLSDLSDDDLIEIYTRGIRVARVGGALTSGATAIGNVGIGLNGFASAANLFRSNPRSKKRDLEDLLDDNVELFAREEFEDFDY